MLKVTITSKNPVKVNAVKNAFTKVFTLESFIFESVSVSSDVSNQPMSDIETKMGAYNRIKNAIPISLDSDYWVGLEGGLQKNNEEIMETFAWMVVVSKDKQFGESRTATFQLPKSVSDLIKKGMELGEADDIVFGRSNSKQENGSVGILTDNIIDREKFYEHSLILALIPFKNKNLFI